MRILNTPLGGLLVSIPIAAALSTYFAREGLPPFVVMLVGISFSLIAMTAVLGMFAYMMGKEMEVKNPLKGYLAILGLSFFVCFLGFNNVSVSADDPYSMSYYPVDDEPSPRWVFFCQFLLYAVTMAVCLYLGLRKARLERAKWERSNEEKI